MPVREGHERQSRIRCRSCHDGARASHLTQAHDPKRTARARRLVLFLPLLAWGCAGDSSPEERQARYRAMIGRSEAELTQRFGVPERRENIEGHTFLTYEQSDVWPESGARSPTRLGRSGLGTVAFECRATFVVIADVVSAYKLSGSGC